jgi:hypothetical protein
MSRQTDYQRRKIAAGLCARCGQARESGQVRDCKACAERYRQGKRDRRGSEPWQPGNRGRPPKGREPEALARKIEVMLSKLEGMEKGRRR